MASKSGRYVRDKLGRFASNGNIGGQITLKQAGQVGLVGRTAAQATKQLAKDGFYNTPNGIKHVSQLTKGQRAKLGVAEPTRQKAIGVSNRSGMSKTQFAKLKAKYKFR